jgi:hypothetical protein
MNAIAKTLLTLALTASAACSGAPTGASAFAADGDATMQMAAAASGLTFSSTQSNSSMSPQTAAGATGVIDFTGSLQTGTPCVNVTASQTTKRSNVTVTVSAQSTGDFCTQVITNNNYQGQVTGLAPGVYTFTVLHSVDGRTSTAYTSTVVVR